MSLFETMGFKLIPKWRLPKLDMAEHLQEIFAKYSIDLVLDVGANRGQYIDFIRTQVEFDGPLICFEPDPGLAGDIEKKVTVDRHLKVYPLALGSENTEMEFNCMLNAEFNSFLTPDHSVVTHCDQNRVSERRSVQVRTLESMLDSLGYDALMPRIYLKMDTQGYDLEVMKGCGKYLEKIVAVQSEISFLPIYEGMPSYRESLDFFANLGFDVTGLFPVNRDPQKRIIEMDCVMLNKLFLGVT